MNRAIDIAAALLFAFVLIFAGTFGGCGKKGDPVPRQRTPPAGIGDLTAAATEDGVLLKWRLPAPRGPESDSERKYFQIWRAGGKPEGGECPGCPRDFSLLLKAPAEELADREGGSGHCRYLDRSAVRGEHYRYRLDWGPSGGPGSAGSSLAEITMKP